MLGVGMGGRQLLPAARCSASPAARGLVCSPELNADMLGMSLGPWVPCPVLCWLMPPWLVLVLATSGRLRSKDQCMSLDAVLGGWKDAKDASSFIF